MCVYVSRPVKIVTFPRKNGDTRQDGLLIFSRKKNTFRNKIMEIVKDFACEAKNLINFRRFRTFVFHFSSCSCFFILFFFHSSSFLHFSFFCVFFPIFDFHFSIFLVFLSNTSRSQFNHRCFLRSRCSTEMWCPDDIGRDSWDWVGPRTWERA